MKKALSCLAVILIALFGSFYVGQFMGGSHEPWWGFPTMLSLILLGIGGIVSLLALADGAW